MKAATPQTKTKADMLPKSLPQKTSHPAMTRKQMMIPKLGLGLKL